MNNAENEYNLFGGFNANFEISKDETGSETYHFSTRYKHLWPLTVAAKS